MRIYEVIDNQLDEAYLAEVDWSKIKKGVATGVISLGLLGLSGLGNAAEITKMSDADVKAYVTQQLKKGNIDKSQVVKAVQKVDSVPAKSNPTKVDEPTEPVKSTEPKPEVKKDEPKKVDTQKPEVKKDGPTQDEVVKHHEKSSFKYGFLRKTKNNLSDQMNDPDSIKFKDVAVLVTKDGTLMTFGKFNAKNKFGAYVGYQYFVGTPSWVEFDQTKLFNYVEEIKKSKIILQD